MTGGKLVARILKRYGVNFLYTLCGGHIMEIYEGCLDEGIKVIDFRDEQSATFAAEATGRITKIPGVAAVTAGPGVMNAVTAVANAFRSSSPLVLIGGQAPTFLKGMGALQEMNHTDVLKHITKWSASVPTTKDIPEYLSKAFSISMDGIPGPVFLEMPMDILFSSTDEFEALEIWYKRPEADDKVVSDIAKALRNAKKPVIFLGSEIAWSKYFLETRKIIEKLGIPTFVNGMARGSLGKKHKLFFSLSRKKALQNADLVILAGVPLDFRLDYGRIFNPQTFLIRLSLDPDELKRNREGNISCVCDPLSALKKLDKFDFSDWIKELEEEEKRRFDEIMKEANSDDIPIKPMRLIKDVEEFVDEKTIVVGDGGDIVGCAAYLIRTEIGNWLDAGPLGTLGAGMGYAIAAKLLKPDHKVFVIFGDGAFGFSAMEYDTAVRHNLQIIGIIGNDAGWTQIKRAQIGMYGRLVATELTYQSYHKVVEGLGGYGEYVEKPDDIKPSIKRAIESGKPAVVNVKIGETELRKGSLSM